MRDHPTLTAKRLLGAVCCQWASDFARGDSPRVVLIGGPTGVGKSTIWRDVAKMCGARLVVEDLSIKVPGDLGIPQIDKDTKRHWFTLPPWWPEPGVELDEYKKHYKLKPETPSYLKSACKGLEWPADKVGLIVVLEELCRANEAVLAGAMNMLLDHQLNYTKAPDWVVFVATTNWAEDGYRGIELDVAQQERVLVADLKPTAAEWAKFSEDRCCPGVIDYFRNNQGFLRLTDTHDSAEGEDMRVPLRTATRVGETVNMMSAKALTTHGRDLLRMYIADDAIVTQLVQASVTAKAGGTSRTPVTAPRLLAGDEDAWEDFETGLAEKQVGMIDTVLDGFAAALEEAAGEEVPETAKKLLSLLDDERATALGWRLVHAGKQSPALQSKIEDWPELRDRLVAAQG